MKFTLLFTRTFTRNWATKLDETYKILCLLNLLKKETQGSSSSRRRRRRRRRSSSSSSSSTSRGSKGSRGVAGTPGTSCPMNPFPTLSWTPGADEHQERG